MSATEPGETQDMAAHEGHGGHGEQVSIRRFAAADSQALKALWAEVLPDSQPHNQPDVVLAAKLAVDDLIVVAEADGELLGSVMAGYDGHRGWLYSVCVKPSARHRGLGGDLVNAACDLLSLRGCTKVNLQVRADNAGVVEFYRTLGFDEEPRISMGRRL